MFGLSLSKLIVLALLGFGAWYLFRMLAGPNPSNRGPRPNAQARGRPSPNGASSRTIDAEDMVRCSVCGTYVPAKGAKACEKPGCPWPK